MTWDGVSGRLRARLRAAVFARDGGVCRLAYEGICTHIATEADHVQAREVAGDGLDNLIAACRPCNLHKGAPGRHDADVQPIEGAWW